MNSLVSSRVSSSRIERQHTSFRRRSDLDPDKVSAVETGDDAGIKQVKADRWNNEFDSTICQSCDWRGSACAERR
jgi:hypothetical protein